MNYCITIITALWKLFILQFCDVYEADILKIPLKITSVKEIYLQLEKKTYTKPHSLLNIITDYSNSKIIAGQFCFIKCIL